jgi:hypothetical protein
VNLREIRVGILNVILLGKDRDKCVACLDIVLNIRFHKMWRDFLLTVKLLTCQSDLCPVEEFLLSKKYM